MTKYAQIIDGIVVNVVDLTDEDLQIVKDLGFTGETIDITSMSQQPGIDWIYDAVTSTFSEPDLVPIRKERKLEVDVAASVRRREIGTAVRGQSEVYTLKAMEAEKYIADSYPADLTNYPWIQMEVAATGLTPAELADSIKSNSDKWKANLQSIELERRKGKININNATSLDDILAATAAAIAAINGLVF